MSSLNGNGRQQVNTYMFASYSVQGVFGPNAGDTESYIADIHALSPEVQEWYDDPVVGYGFKIPLSNGFTYHPEDEVHYSWFAREDPSRAEQGYYTYLDNVADVAQGC